ncbi:MAG: sialidase family protein [Verrucomicrobiales bacterium]|nr:sialidase family protein [Verrucomicrobiales bacterium]
MRPFVFTLFAAVFSISLPAAPPFEIERSVATRGFDGKTCWVHARAGAIPTGGKPVVVTTLQKLEVSGSDIFYALHTMQSPDLGKTWSAPVRQKNYARVPYSWQGKDDLEITVCDFWPRWHRQTGALLGTGHTVVYENNRVKKTRPRSTAYAVFDPETNRLSPWKTLTMPDLPKFGNCGAGCTQRVDLPDGEILLPVYFKPIGDARFSTTVLRCSFDGTELRYIDHGSELSVPVKRGLYEPSLAKFGGRFFLTMRNDEHGYISVSDDGKKFSEPKRWTFDDGADLGNYNTQQHWVTHRDALYLVYTRRGAENDHVFRHRAPLFMAQVDADKMVVLRDTETCP